MDPNEPVTVPRRIETATIERVAVWLDPDAKDHADPTKPAPIPDALRDAARIPAGVAAELGLRHGQSLHATQRVILHFDDARLARNALESGKRSDAESNYVDVMDLLQVVLDGTVTSTNFSMHPGAPNRVLVDDMATPEFAWWLCGWLEATRILDRLRGASNGPLGGRRRSSPGATRGTPSSSNE